MNNTVSTEWWNQLQAGDKVILEQRGYGGWQSVSTVERLTKTQIIVTDTRHPNAPYRFRRGAYPYQIGIYSYNSIALLQWTRERADAIEQVTAQDALFDRVHALKRDHLNGLSTGECTFLHARLTEYGIPERP